MMKYTRYDSLRLAMVTNYPLEREGNLLETERLAVATASKPNVDPTTNNATNQWTKQGLPG